MENERRPLFTRLQGGILQGSTPDDCEWQTVESGVLCIHPPSGARGVAQDRNQAFSRMAETDVFRKWVIAEMKRRQPRMFGADELVGGSDEFYDWQMTENVMRCTHRDSGAIGEGPDRTEAYKRSMETDVFKQWRKAEMWRRWGDQCKCGEARGAQGPARRNCIWSTDAMPCSCFCHAV